MATLFLADLHLSRERPAVTERFLTFLAERAGDAECLYILGDLFEAWVGDDCVAEEYEPVLDALRESTDAGLNVYLQHGNRDFLLGEGFAARTGVRLLPEPAPIDLYGTPTLLLHGDTLCTDDRPYQEMRAKFRDPAWIAGFLSKPPQERLAFARELRATSAAATADKDAGLMDVNADAVAAAAREHGAARIIHGHTHRPGRHVHRVDGREVERLVLGAWDEAAGDLLVCAPSGCARESC